MPDPHGTETDVDIGKSYPEETHPGPQLVLRVQTADTVVQFVPRGVFRYLVETAADQVPEGVAAENISGQEHNVDDQNNSSDADSEAVGEKESPHCIEHQEGPDDIREPQEIAMKVLKNKRKRSFAPICLPWLAHGARRRIGPECLVVSTAVVITSKPEPAGYPKNEQRWRKRQKFWKPVRFAAQDSVWGTAEEF